MARHVPHVAVEAPPGWVATELERPPIAESSGARFTQWLAWRAAEDDAALVAGCVSSPIPGWVEDMRPAVEARTIALAGAAAGKITGSPLDARAEEETATLALRAANDLGGPLVGRARTFVGFDEAHVFTCFAACASRRSPALRHDAPSAARTDGTSSGCTSAIAASRVEGTAPPPEPGIALRVATWSVHHPRPVTLGGLGIVVLAGALAVVLRRRPRSRIDARDHRRRGNGGCADE